MKTGVIIGVLGLCLVLGLAQIGLAQDSSTSTAYVTNTPFASVATPQPDESAVSVQVPNQTPVNAEASPIRIVGFTYDKTPYQLIDLSIEVKNVTDTVQEGIVWYLLAPPGSVDPWNDAVFTAPEQQISLQPGELRSLTFSGVPDTTTQGDYQISTWVHRITSATGEHVHSDGLGTTESVFIGPAFNFSIEYCDVVQDGDSSTVYVTFSVSNHTATSAKLAFSYSVSTPDDLTPWETGVFNLPFKDFTLDPGDSKVVTYRSVIPLAAGQDYQVTGWLHQIVDGVQTQIDSIVYPNLIKRGTE